MTEPDLEERARRQLHAAVDPLVPDTAAEARVLRALRDDAEDRGRRRWWRPARLPEGLGAVVAAAAVFVVVGGGLGLAFGLRGHTTPVTTPTSTASASPASGSPSACDGTSLAASVTRTLRGGVFLNGGNGDIAIIGLRNKGSSACSLDGYANLAASYNGMMLTVAANHDSGSGFIGRPDRAGASPLMLQPGDTGYFEIQQVGSGQNQFSDVCPAPVTLLITPPHGSHAVSLTFGSSGYCIEAAFGIALNVTAISSTPF
jgi:hypothetical protein